MASELVEGGTSSSPILDDLSQVLDPRFDQMIAAITNMSSKFDVLLQSRGDGLENREGIGTIHERDDPLQGTHAGRPQIVHPISAETGRIDDEVLPSISVRTLAGMGRSGVHPIPAKLGRSYVDVLQGIHDHQPGLNPISASMGRIGDDVLQGVPDRQPGAALISAGIGRPYEDGLRGMHRQEQQEDPWLQRKGWQFVRGRRGRAAVLLDSSSISLPAAIPGDPQLSPAVMAHRLLRNVEADGWERSDFPIICESCFGDNPYLRMTKADYDKECKVCTRPFTVFRWRPGRDARYKKTEICQTCTKLKHVCQVCLLDLDYGLPVQVRDTALSISSHDSIPRSDVNREYFAEEHERRARAGIDYESSYGKAQPNDTILKLQRTTQYYKRNRAHVCSFYVRGECTRGAECPYRHEMPETGELSQQNIKDRHYGVNDPVAMKLLNMAGEMPSLVPPEDENDERDMYDAQGIRHDFNLEDSAQDGSDSSGSERQHSSADQYIVMPIDDGVGSDDDTHNPGQDHGGGVVPMPKAVKSGGAAVAASEMPLFGKAVVLRGEDFPCSIATAVHHHQQSRLRGQQPNAYGPQKKRGQQQQQHFQQQEQSSLLMHQQNLGEQHNFQQPNAIGLQLNCEQFQQQQHHFQQQQLSQPLADDDDDGFDFDCSTPPSKKKGFKLDKLDFNFNGPGGFDLNMDFSKENKAEKNNGLHYNLNDNSDERIMSLAGIYALALRHGISSRLGQLLFLYHFLTFGYSNGGYFLVLCNLYNLGDKVLVKGRVMV